MTKYSPASSAPSDSLLPDHVTRLPSPSGRCRPHRHGDFAFRVDVDDPRVSGHEPARTRRGHHDHRHCLRAAGRRCRAGQCRGANHCQRPCHHQSLQLRPHRLDELHQSGGLITALGSNPTNVNYYDPMGISRRNDFCKTSPIYITARVRRCSSRQMRRLISVSSRSEP